jgi:hypothetical protein
MRWVLGKETQEINGLNNWLYTREVLSSGRSFGRTWYGPRYGPPVTALLRSVSPGPASARHIGLIEHFISGTSQH